jgi:hypothetical protein
MTLEPRQLEMKSPHPIEEVILSLATAIVVAVPSSPSLCPGAATPRDLSGG